MHRLAKIVDFSKLLSSKGFQAFWRGIHEQLRNRRLEVRALLGVLEFEILNFAQAATPESWKTPAKSG